MVFAVAQRKEHPDTEVLCVTREAWRLPVKCPQSGKWRADHMCVVAKVPADGKAA